MFSISYKNRLLQYDELGTTGLAFRGAGGTGSRSIRIGGASAQRQVFENSESTRRQYALRERAVALGWQTECVTVIDSDLGLSGATADRAGLQHLVTEVSLGRAGIVIGLEVSRLARNSSDWHRLLEICTLTDTLILDEDGVYNPAEFNDRLLLGLKGTMSEAELHILKARLRGGLLNKARRGELKMPLPAGLVYDPLDRVVLDPDAQVRNSCRILFDTFMRTGSARATVRYFTANELQIPPRPRSGPDKGELHWKQLTHWRVLQMLHNPRYAEAWRSRQVQRARQEANLARQRYRQVDPGNRLVADVLEAEWNACLRELEDAQRECERKHAEDRHQLDEGQRQRILALATDFPRLWNDPATPDRERKRMARLLIEDVTMTKGEGIALRARGLLDLKEMAERLGVTTGTVKKWRDRELLTAHVCNDKGECLYEWPDEPPKPQKRASKASPDMQTPGVPADRSNEVQYEL